MLVGLRSPEPPGHKLVTNANNVSGVGVGSSPGSTSPSLLAGLREQQPDAWQRMVRLYAPLVYGWCRKRGLQQADAEDVAQEVFRAVLARIGTFRRERPGDTFRGWLWTITWHKLGDYLRRHAVQPRAAGGSDAQQWLEQLPVSVSGDSASTAGDNDPGGLHRRALDLIREEFEPTTWQAFLRVVVEDQRPSDVADALGLSLNAVYLAKSRILRRLREALGDLAE